MPRLTLLDVAKLNGADKEVGLIEEVLTSAPEAQVFPYRTIRGTSFPTVTRVSLPTVGFRLANDGIDPSKSEFVRKLVQAYILGGRVEADKAVASAHEEGIEAYEMIEAMGTMKATLIQLGTQIWYGTANEADGFPGIKAALPFTAGVADGSVINATGTTASTASSVYAVKFGAQDVTLIGGNGGIPQLGDFRDETITGENGKSLPGRVADLIGWVGLQIGNINCVRRIANVTAESGKGLTSDLLADLVESFPAGVRPDAIFMSRRSRKQYRKSLTTPERPEVPMPIDYDGIPLYATDSILNTDAIEA
jgi:hypothetical protein